MSSQYTIRRTITEIPVDASWDDPARAQAATLAVDHFWPTSSDHRPRTKFRLLWDEEALHGMFRVEDHYVRAVQTQFNSGVCRDSCVEFFVRPAGGKGYCNFEMNCCGVLLASHITDERRLPGGFAAWRPWSDEEGRQVDVRASLPGPIPVERVGSCVWTVAFRIPLAPLLACTGAPPPRAGTVWHANVYKCGDATSHPHWAAWNPVDELNFHLPRCFGPMRFE